MKKLIIEMPDEANMVSLATVAVEPDGTVANLEDEVTELDLKTVWEEYKND